MSNSKDIHSGNLMRVLMMVFAMLTGTEWLAQTFVSSNLPLVLLNKREPWQLIDSSWDGFEIVVDMSIIDNGPGQRNSLNDPVNGYNGKVRIKVQGSSSVGFPKRSFRITTLDEANQGRDVSLLGLPPHEDWILKSLYQDKSLLRDDLAFHIYNQMGHYSSRSRFVELFVDGEYRGVYQLLEKVKRDRKRVNIAKLGPAENKGDDVTGGYIISLDKYKPGIDKGWTSRYKSNATLDSGNFFLYYYPKPEKITRQQMAYIRGYFNRFEDALAGNNYAHPVSGYRKYIDVKSFIDNFIINELSRNVDGYRASTFFHKDKESAANNKLQAGPIWDFNLGFGNASYNGGNDPHWWAYDQYAYVNFIPWWWRRLLSDSTFRNDLRCRYQELRTGILKEQNLFAYIDNKVAELQEAQERNFQHYPILGQVVPPNPTPVPHTWAGEIAYLKWWLMERLEWMDEMITGNCNQKNNPNTMQGSSEAAIREQVPGTSIASGTMGNLRIELLDMIENKTFILYEDQKSERSPAEVAANLLLPAGHYVVRTTLNGRVQYQQLVKTTDK